MFNFTQTYEKTAQALVQNQKKGFDALNLMLDIQFKFAQTATAELAKVCSKVPAPFTPQEKVIAKFKDDIELGLASMESVSRDALKSGQRTCEKALEKTLAGTRSVLDQATNLVKTN